MKANVDKDTCIGCGACPSICPEVFSMDDDGLAKAIDSEIPEDVQESDPVIHIYIYFLILSSIMFHHK